MKKILIILILVLLNVNIIFADEDFTEAKRIIDSKVTCNELTDEQLELIGDYYMEQMHPGEAHELMDNMMGGEGSLSLKQMHINMAKRLYCNEDIYVGYGMMGSGMGMMNMMYGNYYGASNYYSLNNFLLTLLLISLIVLVVLGVVKLLKNKRR